MNTNRNAKKSAAVLLAAAALVGGSVVTATGASAVPDRKCTPDAENFQIVNGQCVSDGRAEHLDDDPN